MKVMLETDTSKGRKSATADPTDLGMNQKKSCLLWVVDCVSRV